MTQKSEKKKIIIITVVIDDSLRSEDTLMHLIML